MNVNAKPQDASLRSELKKKKKTEFITTTEWVSGIRWRMITKHFLSLRPFTRANYTVPTDGRSSRIKTERPGANFPADAAV